MTLTLDVCELTPEVLAQLAALHALLARGSSGSGPAPPLPSPARPLAPSPATNGNGNGQVRDFDPPKTTAQLCAWAQRRTQAGDGDVTKMLSRWGTSQGLGWKLRDWPTEAVPVAYAAVSAQLGG
jgi:hypothetical protein